MASVCHSRMMIVVAFRKNENILVPSGKGTVLLFFSSLCYSPCEDGLESTRLLAFILFFFFLFLSVIASPCNNLLLVDFDVSLSKKQQYANIQIPILFFSLFTFVEGCSLLVFYPCVFIWHSTRQKDPCRTSRYLTGISVILFFSFQLTCRNRSHWRHQNSFLFLVSPCYARNRTMAIIISTCSRVVLVLIDSIVCDWDYFLWKDLSTSERDVRDMRKNVSNRILSSSIESSRIRILIKRRGILIVLLFFSKGRDD